VGAGPGAGWIRYVLIPSDSKETNRLIILVVTTFEEVTEDSLSFKSKNELGTRWAILRNRCRCCASAPLRRLAMTQPLFIAPELLLPRAAASIESP
jgi:hypothetical protein